MILTFGYKILIVQQQTIYQQPHHPKGLGTQHLSSLDISSYMQNMDCNHGLIDPQVSLIMQGQGSSLGFCFPFRALQCIDISHLEHVLFLNYLCLSKMFKLSMKKP